MSNSEISKSEVAAEFEKLRKLAEATPINDMQSGSWFATVLQYAMSTYTKRVNAEFFRQKYPDLPRDAIVDRRIVLAKRYSALAGGMTASAYTAAVAATLGTAGGASPLTLPAAAAAFAADLFLITQLQLKLAYDLAILYDHPIDIEDPEDLYELIRVAFGIKTGEAFRNAAMKLAPEATRVGVKVVASGSRLAVLKSLPVVGKHLLQRNIIKFAIPVVGIPLSASINYFTTGSVASVARRIFRGRAATQLAAEEIAQDTLGSPLLALQVVYLMAQADGLVTGEEASLMQALATHYLDGGEAGDAVEKFASVLHLSESEVFAHISKTDTETRQMLYHTAVIAASADASLHRKEWQLLKRLAPVCDVVYDWRAVKAVASEFH